MAFKQKAIKVGSSVAAVIPKAIIEDVGITAGTPIFVEAVKDGVLIKRTPQKSGKDDVSPEDERVADTALALIKRYQGALERLADA